MTIPIIDLLKNGFKYYNGIITVYVENIKMIDILRAEQELNANAELSVVRKKNDKCYFKIDFKMQVEE